MGDDIVLLIVGSALTVLGFVVESVLAGRREGRMRRADRVSDLNRETSTALAMVRAVLIDANPDRIAFNASEEHSHRLLADLSERWQPARLALFAASDRHPDAETRDLARKLTVAVHNLIISDGWLVRDVLQHRDFNGAMQRSKDAYSEGAQAADELAARCRLQAET
jgi:hypothetical protein